MFPKGRFHKLLKPAIELFMSVFDPQSDVRNWKRTTPESKVIYETFEELKRTVDASWIEFHKNTVPPPNVEINAEKFRTIYNVIESVLISTNEYEDWYNSEIGRAMRLFTQKMKEHHLDD